MKVSNLPNNYAKFPYMVITKCNGEWWFYEGWKNRNNANESALALQKDGCEVMVIESVNATR